MNNATHYMSLAAKKMGIPFDFVDEYQAVLVLHFPNHEHFIVNTKFGLVSNAEEYLGKDKDFQYTLLKKHVSVPKTRSYLDPKSNYGKLAKFKTQAEIATDIEMHFSYPLILKKNQGSQGLNVFLVKNSQDLREKVAEIFNLQNSEYDFVLLAQEYVKPVKEYRVVVYHQKISFAYIKDVSQATFSGNLSPLHWENAKALLVEDEEKLAQLEDLCQHIYEAWPIEYAGFDIIEDSENKLWLIEVNTNPSLAIFMKDNGEQHVEKLYLEILADLKRKYIV